MFVAKNVFAKRQHHQLTHIDTMRFGLVPFVSSTSAKKKDDGPSRGPQLNIDIAFHNPICSMVLEYLPTFARTKSPRDVVKYTSTMEHMGYITI